MRRTSKMPESQVTAALSCPIRQRFWNPIHFLACGGTVLVTIGLAGISGVLGLISRASLFHPPRWINWFHLSVGLLVLLVAWRGSRRVQRIVVTVAAVAGTTIGVGGFALSAYSLAHHAQSAIIDVSDPLTHLLVGSMAIWALLNGRGPVRNMG